MAQETAIATVDKTVYSKLAGLKRHLRGRLAGEGLAWMLVTAVAAVFVTLGIDLALDLDPPYRVAMTCTALAAVAWTLWRELLSPMLVPMGTEDLALLVERRHKQLGDRLISALQFIRPAGTAHNESPAMVAETVRRANAAAAPLDLGAIVERRNLNRVLAISACTLALLVGFSVWQHRLMWPWLQRNVMFADVDYPQDTYLEVTDGPDYTVLRGTDLKIVIRTEERSTAIPPHVTVHAYFPSQDKGDDDGWREAQADLKGKDGQGRDHYTITFERVTEEFRFFVTGGDDRRVGRGDDDEHHKVHLIDPPALANVGFKAQFPPYLAHEQNSDGIVSDLLGTVSIPAGSTLTVSAVATKKIQTVRILLNGQPVPKEEITLADKLEITWVRKFDAPPRPAGAPSGAPARRPRSIGFELAFELKDTDGYTNVCGRKKIDVQLDRAPGVKSKRRITILGDLAAPSAIIPLISELTDDHDLLAARVSVEVVGNKTAKHPDAHVQIRKPGDEGRITRKAARHEVDLRPYALVPDNEVVLVVIADDSLPDLLGGPNEGRGAPLLVKIVTPSTIQEKLAETAGRVRDEFEQAIALQQTVRDGVRAGGLMLAGGKTVDVVSPKLALLAGGQSAVGPECRKVADGISDILEARVYNRLDSEEYYENVRRKIIAPLRKLAGPLAETAAAIKHATNTKDRNLLQEQIISITETQDAILKMMADVKDEMDNESTRRDIINSCTRIIDWSKEQLRSIRKRSDAEAGSVFDKKKKDKKDDKPKGTP